MSTRRSVSARKLPKLVPISGAYWLDSIIRHGNGQRFAGFANTFCDLKTPLGLEIRSHDLRHFYAYVYLRRGGRLEGLKSQLGHKNIATTEIYAHFADDLAHWDLVVMGERVATKSLRDREDRLRLRLDHRPDRLEFDVRFDFTKCGGFLDSRAAQARSSVCAAVKQAIKARKRPVAKSLQVKRSATDADRLLGQKFE